MKRASFPWEAPAETCRFPELSQVQPNNQSNQSFQQLILACSGSGDMFSHISRDTDGIYSCRDCRAAMNSVILCLKTRRPGFGGGDSELFKQEHRLLVSANGRTQRR